MFWLILTIIIDEFLFGDYCALNATTKAKMQNSVDKISMACDNFGLTISIKNQKWRTSQPAPGKPYVEPNITIQGQRLKVVEKFIYLSSTLTKWTPDSQKRLLFLTDSSEICRIGEASRRQPKSKYTELSLLPPSFMAVKRGQLINGI